jgi:hypothetical protein
MGCPSLTLRVTIAHNGITLPGGVNNPDELGSEPDERRGNRAQGRRTTR